MRQSQLFTKTRKEAPADEVSNNAKLLVRAGFVHKEMAGAYAFLPLGLRVMTKIEEIIREEMNAVGGQEIHLTALQEQELWEQTDRWDDEVVDVWFKTKLKNDTALGLATTHEEPLTRLLTQHINSYRDLPTYIYQFQTKFRNELRAKSGLMRGREFLMKDLYSFSRNDEEHEDFYQEMKAAYERIFDRVGIGELTYYTYASGGSFSEASHEFQTLSEAGEDTIYLSESSDIAINKEMYNDETVEKLGLEKDELEEKRAIEVGNIFPLGTKFSKPLGLTYMDEDGKEHPIVMGSYGIGLGRLMGTVVEVLSDDDGIVWPTSIAPYGVHIIQIGDDDAVTQEAEELYDSLQADGVEVLYDDREAGAGEKLSDADLIGIPHRVVVSGKTLEDGAVGYKRRSEEDEQRVETAKVSEYIHDEL